MKIISLTIAQIEELRRIAEGALPNESCALLLAERNDGKVARILPMRNVEESPVSFTMDPSEVMEAYNIADSFGMQVIAIFHSHPAKPSPSSIDIKFMEINPVIWLIYSTTENVLKAFLYNTDVVEEIGLNVIATKE
ncbi:MAG: Mov34/MPN/PAD-1 family protein [Nitrososphaera sp.]